MAESIVGWILEIIGILHIVAAIGLLVAIVFAYKLYKETDKGWYWAALVLSAFFFALSHWAILLFPMSSLGFEFIRVVQEGGEIVASLLFAFACYGMHTTMKKVRQRIE